MSATDSLGRPETQANSVSSWRMMREDVACLLERIRLLEQKDGSHGYLPGDERPEDECDHCDAKQVFEPVDVDLQPAR